MYDYATRQEQLKIEQAIVDVSTQVDTIGNSLITVSYALLFVLVLNIVIKFVRALL